MISTAAGRDARAGRAAVVLALSLAALLASTTPVRAEDALSAPGSADAGLNEERAKSAFRQAPESVWLGLILLELEIGIGKLDEALVVANDLVARFPKDPQVWAQRGYLMFMLQDFKQAVLDFSRAVKFPIWTSEQQRGLRFALADSALAAGDPLQVFTALEPLDGRKDPGFQIRLAKALLVTGGRKGAATAARLAGRLAVTAEDREEAIQLLARAIAPPEDRGGTAQLNKAYAHLRHDEDAEGLAAFRYGFSLGAGTAMHYADAAYVAKRLGENRTSIWYFRQSLDMNEVEQVFEAPRVFGFQREVEVLQRSFGGSLGTPYTAGGLDILQGGVEAYWQPPVIGYRDGRTVQIFLRGYQSFRNGPTGPTGVQTAQGGLGVRYKPLVTQNLVLTAERLIPLGQFALADWLFRVGYSTGAGTDLNVAAPYWKTWQVYSEAAYFVNAQHLLVSGEARYGITVPVGVGSRWTWNGYPVLAADFDNQAEVRSAVSAGAGLGTRYWFRESPYDAPASWLDIHVQYRLSQADRAQGLLVRALLWF